MSQTAQSEGPKWRIGVAESEGVVVMSWSAPGSDFYFDPQQALAFGQQMIKNARHAQRCRDGKQRTIILPGRRG